MTYQTRQVVLKEKLFGHDAKNLDELDKVLNEMGSQGWHLNTMTTTVAGNTGIGGGDRTIFTLVFEK